VIRLFTGEEVSILGVSRIEVVDQKQWNLQMTACATSFAKTHALVKDYNKCLYHYFNALGFVMNKNYRSQKYWEDAGKPNPHIMFDVLEYSQDAFHRLDGRFIGFQHGKKRH